MHQRTLLLLRHAKSDWSGGGSDFDRPLNERGLGQAPEVGRWLGRNVDAIDLAVVSPANRARTTWALASAELSPAPPTRFDDELYGAFAGQLLEIIRTLPDDATTVILVCHNPGVEELVELLTGQSLSMSTAALAVLGIDGTWSTVEPGSADLRVFGRPPADRS